MSTRVVAGRSRVVREIRAAGPLAAALRAPIPARGPWQTVVLNTRRWSALPGAGRRPVAVVVEPHRQDRPSAVACLELRRRGPVTTVTLLGQDAGPLPGGRPPFRLLAEDDAAAGRLAAGVLDLLAGLSGAWTLRLAGLPLGDPTLAALAARLPTAALRTSRSRVLIDGLDGLCGEVRRSRHPAVVESRLGELLAAEPDRRVRLFVRAAARLHAAIGQLEVTVLPGAGGGLLTLIDGEQRWPWWAPPGTPGVGSGMGSPLVGITAQGGARLGRGMLSPRTGEH
jgi:hypothetical protein